MKYICILFFLMLSFPVLCYTQTREISPADMRYSPPTDNITAENRPFLGKIAQKSGYAFLASAALPGLGQAANQQWWKTGLFLALEATAIGIYIHNENTGRRGERHYERFADRKWSVVAYARWLVETYDYEADEVLNPEFQGNGIPDPQWDTAMDWEVIDIEGLRELEGRTPYASGFRFSHVLPDYGSQQYYELISKYFQFGPGWRDWTDPFNGNPMVADIDYMPENWLRHADIGYRFNNDLRIAGSMVTLLVANHFVSAFDAYFSHILRNKRVQPSASMRNGLQIRLTYKF